MRILVIRLGALGDFALSFPAFASIRRRHAADQVVLLTTAPYAELACVSPWFDEVRVDTRPGWLHLAGLWQVRQKTRGFDFVYDLQTSRRSSRYYWLAGRPPWSGIARFASHQDRDPARDMLHSIDRMANQLALAGIPYPVEPDLSWLDGFGPRIDTPYALLVPATSGTHGGAKTWPLDRFAALAGIVARRGWRPVIVGSKAEAEAAASIVEACPDALDLTGKTSLLELAGLSRRASLAIGGDTGPIHLAAMMGAQVVALFSRFSDPVHATPVKTTTLLRVDDLRELTLERVAGVLPAAP